MFSSSLLPVLRFTVENFGLIIIIVVVVSRERREEGTQLSSRAGAAAVLGFHNESGEWRQ